MGYQDDLVQMGFVPKGVRPKTIQADGSAQWQDNSRLGRMAKTLQTIIYQEQVKSKQRVERMKYQADMYKTLRDAGYDPKTAYEATQNNRMPSAPPEGVGLEEEGKRADIDYKRARTQQITEGAKTPVYDQKGKLLYFIDKGGKIMKKSETSKITTAQLQARLKFLSDPFTPASNKGLTKEQIEKETAAINKSLSSMSFGDEGEEGAPAVQKRQFSGEEEGDVQSLVDEYNSTEDQDRALELEGILKRKGVVFN